MGKHYCKERREPVRNGGATHKRHFRRVTGAALLLCAAGAVGVTSFATVLAEDAVITTGVIDRTTYYSVSIPSTDVDLLLQEAGITLGEDDVVVREDNASGTTVTVKRKLEAEIDVDGKTIVAEGYSGDTVGQLIENAGVELEELDAVTPCASTQVWDDTDVTVTEMKNVYIVDNYVARNYLVPAGTVDEAAEFAGVTLGKEDFLSDSGEQVTDDMVITVNRVTYQTVEETETIPFDEVEQKTDSLYVGESEVKTEGQNGKKLVTYRQKLINGTEADKEALEEEVLREAVDQVVLVGSKEEETAVADTGAASNDAPASNAGAASSSTAESGSAAQSSGNTLVDSSGNVVSYQSMLSGTCTAYSGGGTTSTGVPAQVGVVAVNPNQIPYGTKLYIASPDGSIVYGYAVAGDTGGAMMAGQAMVDLYMNSEQECINFGRRTMNIYILE